MNIVDKEFNFPSVIYNGIKHCPVTVKLELKPLIEESRHWVTLEKVTKGYRFSASGEVWMRSRKDIYTGGQILDELPKLYSESDKVIPPKLKKIIRLWKKYHLNYLKAGTKKQEEWFQNKKNLAKLVAKATEFDLDHSKPSYNKPHSSTDYHVIKAVMDEDSILDDRGYIYGTDWLYMPIPDEDSEQIIKLLNYERK